MITSAKLEAPKLKSKLEYIKQVVDQGWREDAIALGESIVKELRESTPRSDLSKQHIADGWELHVIGGKAKSAYGMLLTIYNKFVTSPSGKIKESAKLKVKKVKQTYTLLHILEYGSKAHKIEPWKKKYLHFEVDGQKIFSKLVFHPGTKAYGMIRTTRAKAVQDVKQFFKKWINKIEAMNRT